MSSLRARIAPLVRPARRAVKRRLKLAPLPPATPILIACHHRSGSTMMYRVFEKLCRKFEWTFEPIYGRASRLPQADVVFLVHGVLDAEVSIDRFAALHVIRDPRDVVISGYSFHQGTSEKWCVNVPDDRCSPIRFPHVDTSQEHRPEAWKRAYLVGLGGRSYRESLKSLPREEGIQFEIDRYAHWTAEQMWDFQRSHPSVPAMRFERIMADFDGSFTEIFRLLGIEERWLDAALDVARTEDIQRRPAPLVESNPHYAHRGVSRWKRELAPAHIASIKEQFGAAIVELGYEELSDW